VQRYSLTERGKLIVAMFVVLFIIIPTIAIVAWLVTRDVVPNESPDALIDSPHSDVGLSSNDSTHEAAPGSPQALPGNDTVSESPDSQISNLLSYDLNAGFLTFLFSPETQTTIDGDILTKISELLSSPQKTDSSIIAVEIPDLSDNDTNIVTSAIINAFEALGVSINDIVFLVYQSGSDAQAVEIIISLQR